MSNEVEIYEGTGSDEPLPGRCGSKLRGKEKYCKKFPVSSNGRCRLHGGVTPVGILSANYVHGRRSRYPLIPQVNVDSFKASLEDPDIHSLRDNIALVDSRINELLSNLVDAPSSAYLWDSLRETWFAFLQANKTQDKVSANKHLTHIGELITEGDGSAAIWNSILSVTKARKELVDSDAKRMALASQVMTNEQALGLFHRVIVTVKEAVSLHIQDKEDARAFLTHMSLSLASILEGE